MIDRAFLESKPNWIATFERPLARTVCLMASCPGAYYWHTPDLYAWGATSTFYPGDFRDQLKDGRLRLLSGEIPEELLRDE